MNIYGYMRFSYAGRSDAFLSKSSLDHDTYLSSLFDPIRMEARFHLFETLCIPSLRAQTDQDYRLFILTSPNLPVSFRKRLELAVSDMPQIRILTSEEPHVSKAFDDALMEEFDPSETGAIYFRLDEDDALGIRMIEKMREYAERAQGMCILSAPAGLYLTDLSGQPEILPKFNPFIAIGYALVCPAGKYKNPYSIAHYGFANKTDSMLIPRISGYIHAAHAFSDTRMGQRFDYMNAQHSFLSRNPADRAKHTNRMVAADFPWTSPEGLLDILDQMPIPPEGKVFGIS